MSKNCPKNILHLFLTIIFLGLFLIRAYPVQAGECGDGSCKPKEGETCVTCPEDCGDCPTPSPTSTPTPSPTSTPTPTIGPTPTSGSSDSGDSSSSITIYPSITLINQGLLFSGTASISEGVIDSVEYSLDEGNTWSQATAKDGKFDEISEDYTFSLETAFSLGEHKILARSKSLANVYTPSSNYASLILTISPPKVTLDKILPNPSKDQTPLVTGKATSDWTKISKVEVSVDGIFWQIAKRSGSTFSVTLNHLEDGNYLIRARAFDTAGNIGQSETQTLIVDTIPPIIGGGMQTLGPQILVPEKNGVLRLVAGTEAMIALSMKGGVTEAKVETPDKSFELYLQPGTNIWFGKLKFEKEGEQEIKISAIDGALNKTERNLHTVLVEDFGKVIDSKTQNPIEGSTISLYLFEPESKQWVLWEAEAYGQINPQNTNSEGFYSFMVPAGRFYIDVKAPGYGKVQSEIIDISQTTILNFTFTLNPKPKIILNLPIFGKVVISLPTLIPQTLKTSALQRPTLTSSNSELGFKPGMPAPILSLPNLAEKNITLSDFKGKRVLVSFISPWSTPSVEQAPILSDIATSLTDDQELLVVSLQESISITETFIKRGNYKFQVLVDRDGQSAASYKITLLPQHFFIDSSGIIQEIYVGVISSHNALEKLTNLP